MPTCVLSGPAGVKDEFVTVMVVWCGGGVVVLVLVVLVLVVLVVLVL